VDATRVASFPELQPFAGEPLPGFADETVCIAANDIQAGTCADCGGTRVGVEIVETIFAFGVPSVQDFVFVAFRVFNRTEFITAENTPGVAAGNVPAGPYDLENTIVAIAIDADIGEAGDDQIAFLPDVQTMVFWDSDFNEPQFRNPLGFGGITYLQTPIVAGEEVGLQEFTVFTNGNPRPDPSDKETWYKLMTGDPSEVVLEVDPRDVRGMASSGKFTLPQGQSVDIYAAYFFATASGAPPAQLLAEGYKSLATGEIDSLANTDPVFDNFKDVQRTAASVFLAGFVVPTAPPKPDLELIPGDGQITLAWEADPLEFVNPFAKVARDPFARLPNGDPNPEASPVLDENGDPVTLAADQVIFLPERDTGGLTGFVTAAAAGLTGRTVTNSAFEADFVIQDFQGFRVYRSREGSTSDAELIAQFDLVDAVVQGNFCFAAEPVFTAPILDDDGNVIVPGEFVRLVCQDVQPTAIGTNTGLSFAITDRGGSFPNPALGPGLVNGIPVFYSVTAFSVNTTGIVTDPGPPATIVELPGSFVLDFPESQLLSVNPATPPAPLILESGLSPFQQATPRSNASSFTSAQARFDPLTATGEVCDPSEASAAVNTDTGQFTNFRDCSNAILAVNLVPARDVNLPSGEFFLEIDSLTAAYPYAVGAGGNNVWFHWERGDGSPATEIQPTVGSVGQVMDFAAISPGAIFFGFDTDPSDTGVDLGLSLILGADFGVIEDLEVNGTSVGLLGFGGTINTQGDPTGAAAAAGRSARPYRIDGSSLATKVVIGNARDGGGTASREYSHPGPFAQGATSYELTWDVEGSSFSGTLRQLPDGPELPEGGQPKGAANPSTPGDFLAGWNWGFIAPGAPAEVASRIVPAGPLTNQITLNQGDTFVIFVPGQSVYIEGIQTLPQDGDVWRFLIASGFQRATFGREPTAGNTTVPPFRYRDFNTNSAQGISYPTDAGITNFFPGQRYRLTTSGGSNELADADLSAIRVVPNPFVAINEITRGRGLQRILFTNLPPQATIRIYTISGNLVRVLEHSDESGTQEWDVRTRFDLLVASGNYYFHVTTPDGRTHLGRFAVVN
jgi:hypothetical protein